MLKDKHPAGHQIDLEYHLVRYPMYILSIYFECAIEYPLREGNNVWLLI